MVIKRKKSALEDAMDFVASSTNNAAKGVQKTFSNVAKNAGNFYQAFNKDYNNWSKTQEAQAAKTRQSTSGLIQKIIQAPQAKSLLDTFNNQVKPKPSTPREGLISMAFPLVKDVPGVRTAVRTASGVMDAGAKTLGAIERFAMNHPDIVTRGMLSKQTTDLLSNHIKNQRQTGQSIPLKLQAKTKKLQENPYIMPSEEWQQAGLGEKMTTRLPETTSIVGSSAIASLAPYLINPVVGMGLMFGSTAEQIQEDAIANNMTPQAAEALAFSTAGIISAIDKLGAGKVLNPTIKKQFYGTFARKLANMIQQNAVNLAVKGGYEATTEFIQEQVQMLAETSFREVGLDEWQTRSALSAFGGFLGGSNISLLSDSINLASKNLAAGQPPTQGKGPADIPAPVSLPGQQPGELMKEPQKNISELIIPPEKKADLVGLIEFIQEKGKNEESLQSPEYAQAVDRLRVESAGLLGSDVAEKYPANVLANDLAAYLESQPTQDFEPKTNEIMQQLQSADQDESIQALKNDMDQALKDTGQEMVQEEGAQTGPIGDDPFDTTVKGVEAQIRTVLKDDDWEMFGVKPGEIIDEDGDFVLGKSTMNPGKTIIEVVEQNGNIQSKTAYHEAMEVYMAKYANQALRDAAIQEYVESQSLKPDQAKEKLADDFADFLSGRQTFTGQIAAFFHDLLINIRQFMGRVSQAEMLFTQAAQGKRLQEAPATQNVSVFRDMITNLGGQLQQNLTTRVLQQLQGRETIPVNELIGLINQPGVKGIEQQIIREAIQDLQVNGKINVEALNKIVKAQLLPLKLKEIENPYYGLWRPWDTLGKQRIKYEEGVYESPLENVSGRDHWDLSVIEESLSKYFAHVRREVLPDGTLRIFEIQSDLYNKHGKPLMDAIKFIEENNLTKDDINNIKYEYSKREAEIETLEADADAHGADANDAIGQIRREMEMYENIVLLLQSKDQKQLVKNIEAYKKIWLKRILQEEIARAQKLGFPAVTFSTGDTLVKNMKFHPSSEGYNQIILDNKPSGSKIKYKGDSIIVAKNTSNSFEGFKEDDLATIPLGDIENDLYLIGERSAEYGGHFPEERDLYFEEKGIIPVFDEYENLIAAYKIKPNAKSIYLRRGESITDKSFKELAKKRDEKDADFSLQYEMYENEMPKTLKQLGYTPELTTNDIGQTWWKITPNAPDEIIAFRKAGRPNISNPKDFPKKPGELNVNKLDINKKRKKAIYDAQDTEDNIPITHAEVKKYAETVGMDNKTYTDEQRKKAYAKTYNTIRQVTTLDNKIAKMKKEGASKDEIMEMLEKRQKFEALSGSQGRTAGQALNMRKLLAGEINTPMNTVFQSLDQLGINPDTYLEDSADVDFTDADQVIKFWRRHVPATFGDWLDKVRYNSMLSSPNTHIINIASNLEGTGILTPINLTINGAVDALMAKMKGRERQRYAGEGWEYTKAFYKDHWDMAKALKGSFYTLLEKGPSALLPRKTPLDLENPDFRQAALTTSDSNILARAAEAVLDVPSAALAMEDETQMSASGKGALAALKYRQKASGGKIKIKNINEQAKEQAKTGIFRGELHNPGEGLILEALGKGAQNLKVWLNDQNPYIRWPAKIAIPFLNIGTNLAKIGFESNPVTGLINLKGRTDKIDGVSKMIMGGAFMMLAMKYALDGKIVGPEDEDKTKRDQRQAANILPWSVIVDTPWGKQSVQFSKMHPVIGFQFGMAAIIADHIKRSKTDEDQLSLWSKSAAETLQYFNDQTYWRNVGDWVNVLRGDEQSVTQLPNNIISQGIPYRAGLNWLDRALQNQMRAPDPDADIFTQIVQRVGSGLPGLSIQVPVRENTDGKPIEHPNRVFNLFSPYKTATIDLKQEELYNDMVERAKGNKLLANNKKEQEKLLQTKLITTPEQKFKLRQSDVRKDIGRNNIKLGLQASAEAADNVFQWPDEDGEVQTLDLNKYSKKKGGISEFKQQEDMYSDARKIWNSSLSDEEKTKAFNTLGLDAKDVRYDALANNTVEAATGYLLQKLTNQPHERILDRLQTGRAESISGVIFVKDGVVNNLVDAGLISEAEGKWLKSFTFDRKTGKLKQDSTGKKKDYTLKVSSPESRRINIKLPSVGEIGEGGGIEMPRLSKLRTKRTSLKLPPIQTVEPLKLRKISPQYNGGMAQSLSGLGRL